MTALPSTPARRRIDPIVTPSTPEALRAEREIIASRGQVTPLYAVLLHSPAIATGWEALLTAVRRRTQLEPRLRELVILRVAILNGAPYEFAAHQPLAEEAGVTAADLQNVQTGEFDGFDPLARLVLDYTDVMTRDVQVAEPLFAAVREAFGAQGTVELTATVAAYNMVSRVLAALDVH